MPTPVLHKEQESKEKRELNLLLYKNKSTSATRNFMLHVKNEERERERERERDGIIRVEIDTTSKRVLGSYLPNPNWIQYYLHLAKQSF